MINYAEGSLKKVTLHGIGSKANNEGVSLSESSILINDGYLEDIMLKYFCKNFRSPEFHHLGNIDENPVFRFAAEAFDNPGQIHDLSKELAVHLYENSDNPNINSGELLVAHIENILVEDEMLSAIAIFKSETKDVFLQLKAAANIIAYEIGVSVEKPDKGCLILNTEKDDGYKICMIDKNSLTREAHFWKVDFLNAVFRSDEFQNTTHYIKATESFIQDRLKPLHDIDKKEESEILGRSEKYFKNEDKFNPQQYQQSIFTDEKVIEDFEEYKKDYQEYNDMSFLDDFEISNKAVKKHAKVFKSVIKLDKNFHIYVHGNRDLIERGTDESGRKYYKVFYHEET